MNCKALSIVLAVLLFSGSAGAQVTITKCQDKDGNWHYGDFAAESCDRDSKITEIDERGVRVRETRPPPTQEELDAKIEAERQARLEAEREAERQRKDEQLLHTYDSAKAIERARDEHVAALDREMESYRLFKQALIDEKAALKNDDAEASDERIGNLDEQIRQYDRAMDKLQNERRSTVEQYDSDLERYHALTDG